MQKKLSGDFWTFPNCISLSRLIFGSPVTIWLCAINYDLVWLVFLFFVATDWLDGFTARWMNSESSWGMLLDPVADQFFVLPIIWYFWWQAIFPFEVPLALSVREAMMIFIRLKAHRNVPAILTGKLKAVAEYAGIFLILLGNGWIYFGKWTVVVAMFLAGWSFLRYLQIFAEASDADHRA